MVAGVLVAFALLSAGPDSQSQPSLPQASTSRQARLVSELPLVNKTHVPGKDLKPASYLLTVVTTLQDRVVLLITSDGGKSEAMFLATPSAALEGEEGPSGPIFMKVGINGEQTLKGYRFANGSAVDFVYPKSEAVQLATANRSTVLAVDPPSENKPAVEKMSAEAKQLVTLWQLSPVEVGPEKKLGIEARRYEPSRGNAELAFVSSQHTEPASATPTRERETTANVVPVPPQVAPRPQHVLRELPHTASFEPLIALFALVCLALASVMAIRRTCA